VLSEAGEQNAAELGAADDPGLTTASLPEKLRPPPGGIDEAVGPESLRLAAVKGDPTAQFIVASRYLEGNGVAKDYATAASWYRKAADQGLAPAQYRLATLYERGKGLPRDLAAATIWYERAAEKGNIRAMHNAAVIAAGTQGGKPDYAKALRLFTAAAAYGLKDSQYNLAVLYERGYGTRMNSSEAFYWYTLAAKQGDADARKRAWSLGQILAPSVIEALGKRALLFRPTEADPKANVVAVSDESWRQGFKTSAASQTPMAATMEKTSSAEGIRQAQQLLDRLGYDVGEPDGKLGARTATAIMQFQQNAGMAATGTVTAELVEKLRDAAG
jgi:localization factor PodJL